MSNVMCLWISTTGLDYDNDEIIGLAVSDANGNLLARSLFMPERVREISSTTTSVNGIDMNKLIYTNAPFYRDKISRINTLLATADVVIVFNRDYTFNFLYGINTSNFVVFDMMEFYATLNGKMIPDTTENRFMKFSHMLQRAGVDEAPFVPNRSPENAVRLLAAAYTELRKFYGPEMESFYRH